MFSVLVSRENNNNGAEFYGQTYDNYSSSVIYNPTHYSADNNGFISFDPR